ncbi:hypothetical protein SAMN05216588_105284 [Pseudomonas flavescens]|uniref:Type III effector n=1 Tax=Phytopseudomonas flavescens TaxID=29435 RepID=A0A1G8DJD1_9GAMM|nr:hypothetical protein [Pseudomonas flavescens]SDH57788.1 hypothetical protein SAMN05216588_105284 [Pseudomonas flavescens]
MNISPAHNASRPSLELQHLRTQASTAVERATSRNQREIAAALERIFARCALPQEDFNRLVQTRAARLDEKGESARDVENTFAKGEKLNTGAKAVTGFLKSIPFGAAGATLQARPDLLMPGGHPISPVAQNVLTAALYVAYNSVGITPFARSTQNTLFMSAQDKDLDDAMKAHARSKDPTPLRKGLESAATVQSFTAKSGIVSAERYAVDKIANAFTAPEQAKRIADHVKSASSSFGSLLAGAAMSLLQQAFDKSHQRIGPEFMMGRTDWETEYDELKAHSWKDTAVSIGSRALHIPLDIAQDLSKQIQSMFTPTGLVSDIAILGGGLAATETFRAFMHGYLTENTSLGGPEAKLLADLSAMPFEALYFGGWALTAAATKEAAAWADDMINKLRTRGALEDGDLRRGEAIIRDPANLAVTTDQPSLHVVRQLDLEANANARQQTTSPRTSLGGWNSGLLDREHRVAESPTARAPGSSQPVTGSPEHSLSGRNSVRARASSDGTGSDAGSFHTASEGSQDDRMAR